MWYDRLEITWMLLWNRVHVIFPVIWTSLLVTFVIKKGILYNWIYFLSMRVACIFIMTASQSHKTQDSQRQTGIFKCIDQKSLLNTDWFVVNSNGSGPLRVVWSQFSVINYHSARVRNRPPYWNHLYHSIADADISQQNKFRPS